MAQLKFPFESKEGAFYKALCDRLRADDTLNRVVQRWLVWDGETSTSAPSIADMPCVSIRPAQADGGAVSERTTDTMVFYEILCGVEGTDFQDVANLWEAILRVLFPGDGTMLRLLATYNSDVMRPVKPAYGIPEESDNLTIWGQGGVMVSFITNSGL